MSKGGGWVEASMGESRVNRVVRRTHAERGNRVRAASGKEVRGWRGCVVLMFWPHLETHSQWHYAQP